MATKDDIVVGSRWRARGPSALRFASERGGDVVEVRPHAETPTFQDSVVLLWRNGICLAFSDPDFFLSEFELIRPAEHKDIYSAGPNGETAGYLAGLTGNRWL